MIIRKNYSYSGLNREGDDGIYMCVPSSINKRIFIDKLSVELYNFCHGRYIEDIINFQKEKYQGVEEDKIRNDVENVIWFFNNIGMLEIKGDEAIVKEGRTESVKMLCEKDFSNSSNFIAQMYDKKEHDSLLYFNPINNINTSLDIMKIYNLPSLRLSQANGSCFYFKYSEENSLQIDGIIGFNFIENYTTIYINLLITKKYSLIPIIMHISNLFKEKGYKYLKIKFSSKDRLNIIEFQKAGFIQEAELWCESPNDENIFIYSINL